MEPLEPRVGSLNEHERLPQIAQRYAMQAVS